MIQGFKKDFRRNTLNLVFRALSIISKFLLILYVAKYQGTDNLGIYGIFNTSVLLGIQFIGLDFYVFNTRELLREPRQQPLIARQLYFHLFSYVLVFPLLFIFVANTEFITANHIFYFMVILLLEHLSNELYRLLLTLKKDTLASFILFLRTSSWIIILLTLWETRVVSLNLESIYIAWILGNLCSLAFPLVYLSKSYDWITSDFEIRIDWILKGLKISTPFFICTLFLKLLEYSNRYILDYYHGKYEIGVYTFFSNFAGTLSIGVFTLVTMVQFPKIVALGNRGIENKEFRDESKRFTKTTSLMALALSPFVVMGVAGVIWFMGDANYWGDFGSFVILVAANILISFNYATHYVLFSVHHDKHILFSNLAGVLISLILSFLLIPTWAIMGASISLAIGFLIVILVQLYFIRDVLFRYQE